MIHTLFEHGMKSHFKSVFTSHVSLGQFLCYDLKTRKTPAIRERLSTYPLIGANFRFVKRRELKGRFSR